MSPARPDSARAGSGQRAWLRPADRDRACHIAETDGLHPDQHGAKGRDRDGAGALPPHQGSGARQRPAFLRGARARRREPGGERHRGGCRNPHEPPPVPPPAPHEGNGKARERSPAKPPTATSSSCTWPTAASSTFSSSPPTSMSPWSPSVPATTSSASAWPVSVACTAKPPTPSSPPAPRTAPSATSTTWLTACPSPSWASRPWTSSSRRGRATRSCRRRRRWNRLLASSASRPSLASSKAATAPSWWR